MYHIPTISFLIIFTCSFSFKIYSPGVKDGISRKDELYNDIVDEFKTRKLDFPKAIADTEGTYFIQVI